MLDPAYALIITALASALLAVMLVPAPARSPDNEAGIQLALLSAGCVTVIVMGALALLGHHEESTICGAIAWLLVMPCVWLSRAPRPYGEWDEEEDGGGGGSPTPQWPSDPPAPDDRLPNLAPPMLPAARAARPATAPPPVPVMATAVKVQRLLVAQEAARTRAADEVQWLLAATAALPLAQAVAAAAADPPAAGDPPRTPVHAPVPRRHRARSARAEHRSTVHPPAVAATGGTRLRATPRRRSAAGASRPAQRG